MPVKRRDFINLSVLTAGAVLTSTSGRAANNKTGNIATSLSTMTGDVVPITVQEREARIAKAQGLMKEQHIEALILDAGTSLTYFTGISWWPSERPMVAVIPAKGSTSYVCPGFEESRLRELIKIGKDVYAWQEDESPYAQIIHALKEAGIQSGSVAMEERLRFFILDGIRKEAPQYNYVSGTPVTMPCRIIKSAAELALMQKATDITVAAIKQGITQMKEGMSQGDLAGIIANAHDQLGGNGGGGLVLFGESSAFPHGSVQPRTLKKGDIVLMDCGCSVEGYASDITRTVVFGSEPTKRQADIWKLEQASQLAGFNAAKLGAACEAVDAASRKVITEAGFGPGYKLPGLPHRTGHGIGMDGHEWGNMVKGNKQLLQPGMCFSIEPTIAIPGEFGVRLEDCIYMTEQGPKSFAPFAKSISEPFGKYFK
jgi:Xaa-Pro dipeptidase